MTSTARTFLAFAMPVSMLGVLWPDVRARFGQTLGTLGLVSFVYGVARMLTCASGQRMVRRFGTGRAFIVSLALLGCATVVLGSSPTWPVFLAGVAGVGMMSGVLDSIGAVFVTRIGDVSSTGLIHGAYGVGATIGPLIVAVVPTWRVALFISALVSGLALWLAIRTRNEWPPNQSVVAADEGTEPIDRRAAALAVGMFFAFVSIEVATGQWANTYLTDHRDVSDGLAAVGVAGFWGGITVGRLALSRPAIASRVARVGLPTLAGLATVMLAGMVVLPSVLAVVMLVLVGICLAPIVPSLFATTAARVGSAHAQRVAGWQLLAANTGAITVPSITGVLVDRIGPGTIAIVWLAVCILGAPLLMATARFAPQR